MADILTADISGRRIAVSGEGSNLLKLKHALSKVLLPDEIIYTSKTQLAFPRRYGFLVHDVLLSFGCRIAGDLAKELQYKNKQFKDHINARSILLRIQEEGVALTGIDFWDRILKPHQGIAVNCMTINGLLGLCLFDEQGTGKTLATVAAFDIMRRQSIVEIMIVIAQKSILGSWKKEFVQNLSGRYRVIELEGKKEAKFRKLQESADVYLLNYESVLPFITPLESLGKDHRVMLSVDESYFVKNPDAVRSASVRDLRSYCVKSFVLCGTPSPNRPNDIVNQFNIADNGFTFVGFQPTGIETIDRNEIDHRIQERGSFLRRTKDEVLPALPEKRFHIIEVDMIGRQKSLYETAMRELALYLRNLDNTSFQRNLTTYFQKRAALLQICVSPRLIDKTYDELPAKYVALDELVQSIVVNQHKKIVIWSVYTRTLDELESRYQEYGLVRIDGTVTSSSKRAELIHSFQSDPSVNIFIGNPAAAGAGITLHAASECVYISFSNQAAHYLQSLDRIHRIGQTAPNVNYHFIVCRNSIENSELGRISRKEIMQKDLLRDSSTEGFTLQIALDELGV